MVVSRTSILLTAFVVVFLLACWLDHRKVARETDPVVRKRNLERRKLFLRFLMILFFLALGFILKLRNG